MSDTIIKVENISKLYRLGEVGTGTLSHDFNRWWHKVRGKEDPYLKIGQDNDRTKKGDSDYAWALQDINFDVKRGEVLGIIGRNGAGKSTLLKILSRVTTPTSGQIKIKGRIASLLEVGTGFNPELTGRDNIYLNGSILGMRKREIDQKFDEIVAFAEVERYIDTPVKRYSSGMYVRLAFAVAAHLEPEILIVDEVLAVGDADFQKKCLGKMQDVAGHGRTILFVSHTMSAVSKLCGQCVLLEGGQLKRLGPTAEIIPYYIKSANQTDGKRTWGANENSQDARLKMRSLKILAPDESITRNVDIAKPFTIEIEYQILDALPKFRLGLRVVTSDGTIAFSTSDSIHQDYDPNSRTPGIYRTRCIIPGQLLNEAYYTLTIGADIPFVKVLFFEEAAIGFSVEQTGALATRFPEKWPGVVCPHLEWQTKTCGE
jgi:lipopolysaccharide transport system ATP-binding protein